MAKSNKNYRELQLELDELLGNLQSDELDIDEAMKAYERGMALAKELEDYLKTAENKITKIQASRDKKPKQ